VAGMSDLKYIWWDIIHTGPDQRREYDVRHPKMMHVHVGHVHQLPQQAPAHAALLLAVDAHSGRKLDNRHWWQHQRGNLKKCGSGK